jgi:hypothetical protein
VTIVVGWVTRGLHRDGSCDPMARSAFSIGGLMLGRDADEAQEWLQSWTAQVSARAEAAVELSDRVSAVTASASSEAGAVRVTVAASGVVTALELDDRVRALSGAALAETIMATIGRAQASLTARVQSVVRDTVGADSEAGRAVVQSYAQRFPEPAGDQSNGRDNPGEGRRGG